MIVSEYKNIFKRQCVNLAHCGGELSMLTHLVCTALHLLYFMLLAHINVSHQVYISSSTDIQGL